MSNIDNKDIDVPEIQKRSPIMETWGRLRKNKAGMFGLALLTLLIALAVFADGIADYDKLAIAQNTAIRLQPPSAEHIFGTDNFGRDIFARIIHGARISLSMGVMAVFISASVGGMLGAVAAFYGGWIDNLVMRVLDTIVCIPSMLLTLAMVAALGPGITNILIAITISQVPSFTRVVRAAILSIVGQEFVEAAKSYGSGSLRIIVRHILPNAIGPIIVQATMSISGTILSISGLSFLGMGIEPPMPEWGAMLSEGKECMRVFPYLIAFPGMFIAAAALSFNLLGDGLRDALDPKLRD